MEFIAKKLEGYTKNIDPASYKKKTKDSGDAQQPKGALQGPIGESSGFQGFEPESQSGFSASGFSRTQQGDDPNRLIMRDEYGWKMSNAAYEKMLENEKAFSGQINEYKSVNQKKISQYKSDTTGKINQEQARYETAKAQLAREAEQAQGQLNSARNQLGSLPNHDQIYSNWWGSNKSQLRVYNVANGKVTIEGTYTIPKQYGNNLADQGLDVVWRNGGWNLNVIQGGRVRGAEMHSVASQLSDQNKIKQDFWSNESVQGAYKSQIQQWNAANNQLNQAQAALNANKNASASELAQLNTNIALARQKLNTSVTQANQQMNAEIGKVKSARQGQLDAAKKAYEERTAARVSAYKNLGTYKSGDNNG